LASEKESAPAWPGSFSGSPRFFAGLFAEDLVAGFRNLEKIPQHAFDAAAGDDGVAGVAFADDGLIDGSH